MKTALFQQASNQTQTQFMRSIRSEIDKASDLRKMGIPSSKEGQKRLCRSLGLVGGMVQRLRDRSLQRKGVEVFYLASGFRTQIKHV